MTLRIVAVVDIDTLLTARGLAAKVREKIMRHGQVHISADGENFYFDILVDRDAEDLPPAVVDFLRNRNEIVYVAEWDMVSPTGTVLKGTDPGIHVFAGWPV